MTASRSGTVQYDRTVRARSPTGIMSPDRTRRATRAMPYAPAIHGPKRGATRGVSGGARATGPVSAAAFAPGSVALNTGRRGSRMADATPTMDAHPDANHVKTRIDPGALEPADARRASTVVGRMANPAVLIARKVTMAFVATPFFGFRVSSSCIARIPNGVAALPRPRTLLAMLRSIALIAGWSV